MLSLIAAGTSVTPDGGWLRIVRQQGRMGDSAYMPQLKKDSASALVNGFHDTTPRLHLLGRMNPWSIYVALSHGRDLRRLSHDESSRGAL